MCVNGEECQQCANGYFKDEVSMKEPEKSNLCRPYSELKNCINPTIDGCKELHDACRIFKNSNLPSYDIAVENLQKFRQYTNIDKTKITLAPENLHFLRKSMENLFQNLKYTEVHANCVFEEVWGDEKYPKLFYQQLKEVADYLLDNFGVKQPELSLFNGSFFKREKDLKSAWCGGNGKMLFLQYDGQLYNCTRYSITSVGEGKDLPIGDMEKGLYKHDTIALMKKVNRESMYPDKCKTCPIAAGCADCLAYCYEASGGEWKKSTSLCEMHKARCLANAYYWNKYFLKYGIRQVFLLHLPKEDALKIISLEEYEYLLSISNQRFIENLKDGGFSDEQISWICKKEFESNN